MTTQIQTELNSVFRTITALRWQCLSLTENFDEDFSLDLLLQENLSLCASLFDEILKGHRDSFPQVKLIRTENSLLTHYISDLIFHVDCAMDITEWLDEKIAQKLAIVHGVLLSCLKASEIMNHRFIEIPYFEVL